MGHSTRPIEKFVLMLRAHSIDDPRRHTHRPKVEAQPPVRRRSSPRHPDRGRDTLRPDEGPRRPAASCEGVAHERGLGQRKLPGLRRLHADRAIRGGCRGAGRACARAGEKDGPRVAIMCAEGNPFRCHRSLVADALEARGVHVVHISGAGKGRPHKVTPFAEVAGTQGDVSPGRGDASSA